MNEGFLFMSLIIISVLIARSLDTKMGVEYSRVDALVTTIDIIRFLQPRGCLPF